MGKDCTMPAMQRGQRHQGAKRAVYEYLHVTLQSAFFSTSAFKAPNSTFGSDSLAVTVACWRNPFAVALNIEARSYIIYLCIYWQA